LVVPTTGITVVLKSDLLNRNSVWALKANLEAKVATREEDMITFNPLLVLGSGKKLSVLLVCRSQ
jgi:hypothetical protein